MPLLPGKSKSVIQQNFHDFRRGKTFARTLEKYGKKRADAQLAAVVLSNARKTGTIGDLHREMKNR